MNPCLYLIGHRLRSGLNSHKKNEVKKIIWACKNFPGSCFVRYAAHLRETVLCGVG